MTADHALERLVIHTAMEDAGVATECETAVKAELDYLRTVTVHLIATLQAAHAFIADESDNRSAAGSEYSDYEREPRELADQIAATIAWATGGPTP